MLAVVLVLSLSQCTSGPRPAAGGSTRPGSDGSHPVRVGLTGPVGPVARSCHGVAIAAGGDIQRAIDSRPPGTTFCLRAATYRLSAPLVPRRGDAFIGAKGAVLTGAKVVTGWQRHGRVWSATGFLPAAPGTHGECAASAPLCTRTQDVFVDHRRLRPVASLAAVTAGTVFADYGTGTITIGSDPRSHLVEQAVVPGLIQATVSGVTVENLVLEEAANQAQVGAVDSRDVFGSQRAGPGWRIIHDEVRLNHGAGIGFGSRSVVAGNLITGQGQLGFGAYGTGSVITGNEIAFNGAAGYSPLWEAGGGKSWMTSHETFTRNYVHGNMGPGLWDDGGNVNTTYQYNLITGNWGAGIQHEISYDATITYNLIAGNGFGMHQGWAWDAGIQIQSSGGARRIDVANNVVAGNYNGITVIDSGARAHDQPAPYGPHVVRNVWVHDNVIVMSGPAVTGAVEDDNNSAIFNANGNRFSANTYYLGSVAASHFSWADADVNWEAWLAFGNDRRGRAEPLNSAAGGLRTMPAGGSALLPAISP
jgi:parallel beta helix pectate lyase-like protein